MIFDPIKSDANYKDGPFVETGKFAKQPRETWENPISICGCISCGTPRAISKFPLIPNTSDLHRTDETGAHHSMFCEHCLNDLYSTLIKKYGGEFSAINRICAIHGVPFIPELATQILGEQHYFTTGQPVHKHIPKYQLYFRALMADEDLKTRLCIDEVSAQKDLSVEVKESLEQTQATRLTPSQKRDRDEIVKNFGYDPFELEDDSERGRLYGDLITLYDEAMSTDLVRQRAAIEIVKSFARIDKIGRTIQELQADSKLMAENSKTLKELVDQKSKETKMITDFAKDHGFAERYATAKAKGAGSLSSIVRDGFEKGFDKLAVNRFDIETSNVMQQIAEISAQAMVSQINLTSDDFRDMIEEQRAEIEKLQKKVMNLTEANRLLREKQVKEELIDEYIRDLKAKGIRDPEVIDNALKDLYSAETFYQKDGDDK